MNLKGKKVELRELREGDMVLLNKLLNDPEIAKNVVGWSKPITMYEQMTWFHNLHDDSNIRYTIADVKDLDLAYGTAIISDIDFKNGSCGINIKIDNAFQRKGFGKESLSLLINYIFNELNLNRINAEILEYNIGSQKAFESLGFIKEGEKRQAIYKGGKYNDLYIYSLIREDYCREGNR